MGFPDSQNPVTHFLPNSDLPQNSECAPDAAVHGYPLRGQPAPLFSNVIIMIRGLILVVTKEHAHLFIFMVMTAGATLLPSYPYSGWWAKWCVTRLWYQEQVRVCHMVTSTDIHCSLVSCWLLLFLGSKIHKAHPVLLYHSEASPGPWPFCHISFRVE